MKNTDDKTTTIKVYQDTKNTLTTIKNYAQLHLNKKITYDDIINVLTDEYMREQKWNTNSDKNSTTSWHKTTKYSKTKNGSKQDSKNSQTKKNKKQKTKTTNTKQQSSKNNQPYTQI